MHKLLFAFVLAAVTLLAGDVSGKWSGNMRPTGQDNDHPVFLILKQDGTTVTGTGGPHEGEQMPINPGKAEGDDLNFTVTTGRGTTISFKLKINGDEINGDVEHRREDRTETGKVTLKRAKS